MKETFMNQLVVLLSTGMEWQSYSEQFSSNSIPPQDLFIGFIAERLSKELLELPSQITLRVDHASNNHLYIAGSMQRQNQPDIIQGEIVWLPNLNIFRGHILVNPPTGEELLRQDIENFNKMVWTKKRWQASEYPKDDHSHCNMCVQSIYETDDENYGTGYFSSGNWLCSKCFDKYIRDRKI
jgi:hypothetical protein